MRKIGRTRKYQRDRTEIPTKSTNLCHRCLFWCLSMLFLLLLIAILVAALCLPSASACRPTRCQSGTGQAIGNVEVTSSPGVLDVSQGETTIWGTSLRRPDNSWSLTQIYSSGTGHFTNSVSQAIASKSIAPVATSYCLFADSGCV